MPATHTDLRRMLREMYEYSKTSPSSVIFCNDEPAYLLIGFVVDLIESGRLFSIKLSNYKLCCREFEPFVRAFLREDVRGPIDRRRFCDKTFLASIFEPAYDLRAWRKEIKEIEKLRPIITSAFDRLEV